MILCVIRKFLCEIDHIRMFLGSYQHSIFQYILAKCQITGIVLVQCSTNLKITFSFISFKWMNEKWKCPPRFLKTINKYFWEHVFELSIKYIPIGWTTVFIWLNFMVGFECILKFCWKLFQCLVLNLIKVRLCYADLTYIHTYLSDPLITFSIYFYLANDQVFMF